MRAAYFRLMVIDKSLMAVESVKTNQEMSLVYFNTKKYIFGKLILFSNCSLFTDKHKEMVMIRVKVTKDFKLAKPLPKYLTGEAEHVVLHAQFIFTALL